MLGGSYQFNEHSENHSALDLGFGDGRNLQLLESLYTSVYGLEISEAICDEARVRFPNVEFLNGFSHQIKTESSFFDLVLAAHSIYYCDSSKIEDNLREVNRVMKIGGRFIFSLPKQNSYLIETSELQPNNYAKVKQDPLNIRNGSLLKFCKSEEELYLLLKETGFNNISIGASENNWWGIHEFCWIVSCNKMQIDE